MSLQTKDIRSLEITQHILAVNNEWTVGGDHLTVEGRVVRQNNRAVHGPENFRGQANGSQHPTVESNRDVTFLSAACRSE